MGLAAIIPAEGGASRMALSHVEEVLIGAARGVTTVLAHEDLGASLAVGVLLVDAVDLPHVRLQRAALREGFLTELTLVRADPCDKGGGAGVTPVGPQMRLTSPLAQTISTQLKAEA